MSKSQRNRGRGKLDKGAQMRLSNIAGKAPMVLVPQKHNPNEAQVDHNTIEISDGAETNIAKLESFIARRIVEAVTQKYPLRQWAVGVDIPGQMAILKCESVSLTHGYHIHFKGRSIHAMQEKAVKAAGEILERAKVSRNKHIDEDELEALELDVHGNAKGIDNG